MAKLELDSETIDVLSARGTDWNSLGVLGLVRHAKENPKSQLFRDKVKAYKVPRVINGVVVCSYKTSTERKSGNIAFSDETAEKRVRQGNPEETIETLSPEYWDGKRGAMNMHGNRGRRNDSRGAEHKRVSRKSAKPVEIIRK